MNGEKMTTQKKDGAKRVTQKAKIANLTEENAQLRATIEDLKAINAEQLGRLVDQTLLIARIGELKKRLSKGDD